MNVISSHPQMSPEEENCDICVQEGKSSAIPPYTNYMFVVYYGDVDNAGHLCVCAQHFLDNFEKFTNCNVAN